MDGAAFHDVSDGAGRARLAGDSGNIPVGGVRAGCAGLRPGHAAETWQTWVNRTEHVLGFSGSRVLGFLVHGFTGSGSWASFGSWFSRFSARIQELKNPRTREPLTQNP